MRAAGTGKSVLLRQIIKSLRKKYTRSADAVAITASTGIAARTIRSFGGFCLDNDTPEKLPGLSEIGSLRHGGCGQRSLSLMKVCLYAFVCCYTC